MTSANSSSDIIAVSLEYGGLAARDKTATASGTAASPTVSTAAATSSADELVVSVTNIVSPVGVFSSLTPATG